MVVFKVRQPRTLVALFDHIEKCNSCFSRPTVARSFTPDLSPCTIRSPQFSSQSLRTRILSCRSCWEHKSIFFLSSCSSSGFEVCQLRNTVEVRLLVCFSFTYDSLRTMGRKTLYIKYTFCKGGQFLVVRDYLVRQGHTANI
jgi:hypothetical protein